MQEPTFWGFNVLGNKAFTKEKAAVMAAFYSIKGYLLFYNTDSDSQNIKFEDIAWKKI